MSWNPFLLVELVRRDLAVRYAGSFGGFAWALLNPLLLCGLYGLVFTAIMRIAPPANFTGTYLEYLLAGLIPWIGIQDAVVKSATSVTDQAHLVKKQAFPLNYLLFASLFGALSLQAIAVTGLGAGLATFGVGSIQPLTLLVAFLFEFLVLIGPAFALAALNVFFRDLTQFLGPGLTVLFYLTPVLYPEALVPANLTPVLLANPLRDVIGLFRAGLLGTEVPPVPRLMAWSAISVVIAFLGVRFFGACRKTFSDII
jgi:lipopolysaccharide transport system permease protein